MIKNHILAKPLGALTTLAIAGSLVFLAFVALSWSLLIGWLGGSLLSFFSFLVVQVKVRVILKLDSKSKTLFGAAFYILNTLIYGSSILALIFINNYSNGDGLFSSHPSQMYGPINIFTFLAGLAILPLATLISSSLIPRGLNG